MNKIKIRLKKDHYLNGVCKKAGTVIYVNKFTGEWLIGLNRATLEKQRK